MYCITLKFERGQQFYVVFGLMSEPRGTSHFICRYFGTTPEQFAPYYLVNREYIAPALGIECPQLSVFIGIDMDVRIVL